MQARAVEQRFLLSLLQQRCEEERLPVAELIWRELFDSTEVTQKRLAVSRSAQSVDAFMLLQQCEARYRCLPCRIALNADTWMFIHVIIVCMT